MDGLAWRTLSTGRCFVYVLPCRDEDTLKIGFARDPWVRIRAFHPRFHAFFDLRRAAVLETDLVQEARKIEKHLKSLFSSASTVSPLKVRPRASGKFEWFRGVCPHVLAELRARSADLGYALHEPLSEWFLEQWQQHVGRILDWSRREYDRVELFHFNANPKVDNSREHNFRNLLEAWESIGMDLDAVLDESALSWYRFGFAD